MFNKLERLGYRGAMNSWFDSYLSDHQMFVQINDSKSDIKTINIGLPQGAVSSPYLFSLYGKVMHRSSDKLKFIHFADDTTVHLSGSNLNQLCEDLRTELSKVHEWMKANRLSLNVEKTSFMLYTYKTINQDLIVNLNGRPIEQVKTTKFLGVNIDNRLSYNQLAMAIRKKLSCLKGLMHKMST